VRNAQTLPPGDQQAMIRGMVDGLAARLKENPDDREGWLRLGRSYAVLGRQTESLDAYARAASQWPEDPEALQLYARALYEARLTTDGPLPDRIGNLYRRVLEKQGNNLEALYFVGLTEVDRGNAEEGARLWGRLLAGLDPKSDAHAEMTKRLQALKAPAPPK
jgi:cytochrome c-type biogenesis protein CcmH